MKSFILTIDQSTAGTKVLLMDSEGQIAYKYNKGHAQHYPFPGWVSHDPMEIIENVKVLIKEAVKGLQNEEEIIAIAITNQRETALIWDTESGLPIHHAVVWQCRRTVEICNQLKMAGKEAVVTAKTGLKVDPYFSASKFKWLLENVPGAKEKADLGQLMAGTMDSWLIYNLTNRSVYKTDMTNASRTLVYNIYELKWDTELMEIFGLEKLKFPEVCDCNHHFGMTDCQGLLPQQVPILGVIGDSQGALFGQQCLNIGMAKATYGTGTSILMNTGQTPVKVQADQGLVTAIGWSIDGQVSYALEGIINCSGDTLVWLKNNLGIYHCVDEIEPLCRSIENNEGVYLIPALVGYGIPYWQSDAKAAIMGMTRGTHRAHLVRAGVESIVYQIHDAIRVMEETSGIEVTSLKVDGGATSNAFLLQFQSDILNTQVVASKVAELSAMGAYFMAIQKVGFMKSIDTMSARKYRTFAPNMSGEDRERNLKGWNEAIQKCLF